VSSPPARVLGDYSPGGGGSGSVAVIASIPDQSATGMRVRCKFIGHLRYMPCGGPGGRRCGRGSRCRMGKGSPPGDDTGEERRKGSARKPLRG